jgi:hypothetical protein
VAVLRAQIALIPNSSGSYTFRKYGACGSDLAQHGRDRIDQVRRFARGWRPCNGGWDEVGRR